MLYRLSYLFSAIPKITESPILYRLGHLSLVSLYCQELEFWGLTELDIEPCCWGHYNRFKENKETLAEIDDTFTFNVDSEAFGKNPSPFMQFKKKVWIFLEDPTSSREAKVCENINRQSFLKIYIDKGL